MMKAKITDYTFPKDLKTMSNEELSLLAVQIREFLINSVAETGGHLSPNLGVVELTIALHKYLDTPKDKLIFDVGHQCYVHKILTGRADQFDSLRKIDGLSGYPKTKESEFDLFNTGHTSTSLSLMAGITKARDLSGEDYRTVAVIGDGALSGGLAYEALNNLGAMGSKCLVVLNDNEMSIGKNQLALDEHLSRLRVSKGYSGLKQKTITAIEKIPRFGTGIRGGISTIKDAVKYALIGHAMLEEIGFTYLGPVDGHDIENLLEYLEMADAMDEPVLLHVITKKGKGYKPAENNPTTYHGLKPFDKATGKPLASSDAVTYTAAFGEGLTDLAEKDDRIVAISAAMVEGTGLVPFRDRFPDRIFDVGIAEGYAVSFAAGLAKQGYRPVVALYSTFLQRAYDQLIIDVCLNNLPVIFAIDRAGNVGEDGETHHGMYDLGYLSLIPNLTVLAPRDATELQEMLAYALTLNGPCAIRYPKTSATDLALQRTPIETGAQVFLEGKDCEIWAVGNMVVTAGHVVEILRDRGIDAGLINPRFIKPLPKDEMEKSGQRTDRIFVLEDAAEIGGFGAQFAQLMSGSNVKVTTIAWPDAFVGQGTTDDLFERYRLSAKAVAERIVTALED